ncbi:hypothetical protein AB0J38_21865 [Streptomyces sp. NPDC050095]|uniref:hypothetical protein n=1 Tax=unclassified Streptomyces TaxID=2593676 RepID=UPI0034284FEA
MSAWRPQRDPEERDEQNEVVAAGLALTDRYWGFTDPTGRRLVPLDQAGVLAAGRLGDLMTDWEHLSADEHERFGRFWQARGDDLAREADFTSAALYYAASGHGLYAKADGDGPGRGRYVVAVHGDEPLAVADRHLHQAARLIDARKALPTRAGEGLWQFGTREITTVRVPRHALPAREQDLAPLVWRTTPRCDDAEVRVADVLAQVRAHEQLDARVAWKPALLEQFFDRLRDQHGNKIDALELPAGRLSIVNAPTGVGKSVAMLEIAILAARQRQGPVLVVVPQLGDVFKITDKLRTIVEHDLDDGLLDASGQPARRAGELHVSSLITPSRMAEQAARALTRGRWDRFDLLAYPCDLKAWITHGPGPAPGDEPCLRLRRVHDSDADAGELTETGPSACPRIDHCPRFALLHDAARADIIVTNHHNLLLGSARLPLDVDGQPSSRESLLKLLLGRCPTVLIDEVDGLQATLCDTNTKQLALAAHGPGTSDSPLVQLDRAHRRRPVPPSVTRRIADSLRLARHFAESFLDNVLEGELWLETYDDDHDRPSSNLHVPGTWDRRIAAALLHKNEHDKITYAEMEGLKELFPAPFQDKKHPSKRRSRRGQSQTDLPQARAIRALLEEAINAGQARNVLPFIKDELTTLLEKNGHHGPALLQLVNALLVRTWLGCLTDALTKLRNVAAAADAFLPEARPIAELLGTFAQHSPIPHGALGDSLYGFAIAQNPRPHPTGRLDVRSFTGDPHTTMTQLGNTIALGTCGKRRRVLAFSATAFFPRAAKTHLHTLPAYLYSDTRPDAVRAKAGHVTRDDDTNDFFRLAGLEESAKVRDLPAFGGRLWKKRLEPHLRFIAGHDPDRQLVLTVTNSTHHAFLLASGIATAAPQAHWVAVVLPASGKAPAIALPPGVVLVTVDELEELPARYPDVKVIVAPIGPVCRGLNILVPGTERSALYSIWVGTRPVMQIHDPNTMYASINAAGISRGGPSLDPAAMLTAQRHAAEQRRDAIIAADPRFSRYPRFLKTEILAGILVDLIQLAGRARRGDTDVEIYLVDNAFHDARFGSDYPSLLRTYYAELEPGEQQQLRHTYGATFDAWIDFASGNPPPLTTLTAL